MDIRVRGIVKEFGEAAALRDVSLEVRSGELMALLGPSGSGKTTLLRVIAGLEIADQGHVYFGGQDATSLPVQRRQVGFVFQHYALFRHLNVADNIAYGLRARPRALRPDGAGIRQRVDELLDLVQLSGLEKRFPAQLSGGQRQRVALARALAVEPRVLLLDEPFGALDAKVRKDLRRWLREIHDKTGRTTIFVTHDQDEALELADRVAILNDGRIEQVGTADEVQDQPASAFVVTFIGDATRIPAQLRSGRLYIADREVHAELHNAAEGDVDLFCRPWHLLLVEPGSGHLVGTVRAIRRVGQSRRLNVEIAGGTTAEVEVPTHATPSLLQSVGLAIVGGHVFPKTAGKEA